MYNSQLIFVLYGIWIGYDMQCLCIFICCFAVQLPKTEEISKLNSSCSCCSANIKLISIQRNNIHLKSDVNVNLLKVYGKRYSLRFKTLYRFGYFKAATTANSIAAAVATDTHVYICIYNVWALIVVFFSDVRLCSIHKIYIMYVVQYIFHCVSLYLLHFPLRIRQQYI